MPLSTGCGACNRGAALLGVSDGTIRRAMRRVQDRDRAKAEAKATGLTHVPPPGGYTTPELAAPDELAARSHDVHLSQTADKSRHAGGNAAEPLIASDEQPYDLSVTHRTSIREPTPHGNTAERRTLEREETLHDAGETPHPKDKPSHPTEPL